MERYLNTNGNSPVTYYQINEDSIEVWFKGATKSYKYSYRKAGKKNVDNMKVLARNGSGLSAFITKNVRFQYD